ncbi:putative 2-amino-3-carboxymuconate-6-semialdehyde decarboxylase [Talaromyces proteolyticus]|uniref:2-amino-3-carboxymuconate-6-semialdehyde decarboxylase n=1 Tax=Talaromyces proteolyticus TaxID=1131652 RepID=A0AAD4KNJ9_9EURO|nr:putative 2-amino-3-carboxymuconate-6-semialdehyde decarboxylase [Talaromyces proteolyticus]KAH8696762.1 putative 2-amino-3-carboxymuconate-6-semialdehyde decarboxylase [Talaromyces proteolyticus]
MIPTITLEEHFVSEAEAASAGQPPAIELYDATALWRKLRDLGDERIKDMDEGDVSFQVISHNAAYNSSDAEVCRKSNDELYGAITRNPTRFAGFATLPMGDAAAATEELERCVKELGFLGALVCNHARGEFYDGKRYHQFFAKLQELDVPLYLHPTNAWKDTSAHYEGNYRQEVSIALGGYLWGWHSETGLHFLRLFHGGLFDKFPKLKIVLGHNGEMLPFMIDRINNFYSRHPDQTRSLMTVWNENIWITTSGMFTVTPFATLIRSTSVDRILYSIDYPFEDNKDGQEFLKKLKRSGFVTDEEMEKICYKNAEKLLNFKLKALE